MKKAFLIFCLCCSFIFSVANAGVSQPVAAAHGMVVSEERRASQVGVDILRAGGNAIDAAVAVGYALAVTYPCCGNIGGGGFMTIHFANGKDVFLNFREKAPLAATADMFLDAHGNVIPGKSTRGYLAVAVPGTVMGLDAALQKFGTLPRQQVIAPAIRLAQQTKQFHLEKTLKQIAAKGPDAFYKGPIAAAIVQASQTHGGILSLQDFAQYNIEELSPIRCNYRGYTIISAPPPSSGGVTLCEALNILEGYPLQTLGFHSAASAHYVIEAMRYAFADRNNVLGDPDFVKNPVVRLISKDYAKQQHQQIPIDQATPSNELPAKTAEHEGNHTTHYSIIDKQGNAVAVTYTLNSWFGAKVIAGDTGFLLNDEMDDFSSKSGNANQFKLVQGSANRIQPGKRALSSMAPTIVTKGDQVFMVLGSRGGPRIITATLQTILNVIDYDMNIQAAVDAPRFHQQW
jgi:gamma-glutamyltranspeptidase/glutathione hydrolase